MWEAKMQKVNQLEAAFAAMQASDCDYRSTQMFVGQAYELLPWLIECARALRDIQESRGNTGKMFQVGDIVLFDPDAENDWDAFHEHLGHTPFLVRIVEDLSTVDDDHYVVAQPERPGFWQSVRAKQLRRVTGE